VGQGEEGDGFFVSLSLGCQTRKELGILISVKVHLLHLTQLSIEWRIGLKQNQKRKTI